MTEMYGFLTKIEVQSRSGYLIVTPHIVFYEAQPLPGYDY